MCQYTEARKMAQSDLLKSLLFEKVIEQTDPFSEKYGLAW